MAHRREYTRMPSGIIVPTGAPVLVTIDTPIAADLSINGQAPTMIEQDEYEFIPDSLERWSDCRFKPHWNFKV